MRFNMQTVRAKRGVYGGLYVVGGLLTICVFTAYLINQVFSPLGWSAWDWGLLIITAFVTYSFIGSITTQVGVSNGILQSREFGRKTVVDLSKVESIELGYYGFGHSAFNLHLESTIDTKRRTLSLSMAGFANRDQVAKAIVDATLSVNPNVKLSPEILERFGPPPYGIFLSKRGE